MVAKRKRTIQDYKQFSTKGRKARAGYTTNSTQTSPRIFKEQELLVLIKRLPKQFTYSRTKTEQHQDEFTSRTIVNLNDGRERQNEENWDDDSSSENDMQSLITMLKRPDVLSRLPSNYDHFIRPITNNERANSTLDHVSINKDLDTTVVTSVVPRRRNPVCRTIKNNYNYVNIKPGPKCSKPQDYLQLMECNGIPAMLDGSDCRENTPSLSLSPIIERSDERTCADIREEGEQIKSFAETSSLPKLNNVTDITEIGLLKEHNASVPRVTANDSIVRNNSRKQQAHNVNMTTQRQTENENVEERDDHLEELNGEAFTSLVRSERQEEVENVNDDTRASDANREARSHKKKKRHRHIIIEADTVHIHNHFYNQ
ncbi:hypothetical protein Trydic_g3802 [Trypoxylus dichotomus]